MGILIKLPKDSRIGRSSSIVAEVCTSCRRRGSRHLPQRGWMAWTLPPSWEKVANCWSGGCCQKSSCYLHEPARHLQIRYLGHLFDLCPAFWHAKKNPALARRRVAIHPLHGAPPKLGIFQLFDQQPKTQTHWFIYGSLWHWVWHCGIVHVFWLQFLYTSGTTRVAQPWGDLARTGLV